MTPARAFLFAYNYVFPPVGFPLFCWLWYRAGGWPLAVLVMGLPLVFGYVLPGIGTNVMKKWRFRGRWLMGHYFAHHGFIYASTMGLALYVAAEPVEAAAWPALAVALRCAALVGFVGWWHDLIAVRAGMVEIYNPPWKRGAGPEAIVAHYAPICFSILGASYGIIGAAGRHFLAADARHLWWLFPVGLVAMSAATCVPYLLLEKH